MTRSFRELVEMGRLLRVDVMLYGLSGTSIPNVDRQVFDLMRGRPKHISTLAVVRRVVLDRPHRVRS